MKGRFARARLLSLLLLAALPRVAHAAAPQDAQTAEALYQSGKEAMERGDLASACARFTESVRLDPSVGGFLNLADCEERAGRLASALAHFQAARDRLRADDYRVAFAGDRIAKLTPRVPRLTVLMNAPADGATVLRDETRLGAGSLGVALPVDPGLHVLVVRAPGRADAREEVTLREGESRTIDLAPGPRVASPPTASPVAAKDESAPPVGRTQRTLGITLGGAGIVLLATGAVVGLVSKSTYDDARKHCPTGPTSCTAEGVSGGDRAYTQASVSTIAFLAGGAFFAGGLALYLTAPHAIAIAPAAGAHHAGLSMEGTF